MSKISTIAHELHVAEENAIYFKGEAKRLRKELRSAQWAEMTKGDKAFYIGCCAIAATTQLSVILWLVKSLLHV